MAFDRNSQVCFHKNMVTGNVTKATIPLLCLASGIITAAHAALSPVNVTNIPFADGVSGVLVSGKYLYTVGSGFQVFDVSSPANPTYVGGTRIPGGGGRLAVWENYAYVTEGNAGMGGTLHILDISDPANPVQAGHIDGIWGPLIASGGCAYVGGSDGSSFGVFIYDLSNPSSPTQLGHVNSVGPFDVSGEHVYVVTPDLQVWDVSDPALPVEASHASAPTALAYAVAVQDSNAFVVTGTNGLPVYNVSDPAHPVVVADLSCWTGAEIAVSGNYAYAAWGSVFTAFDISNPTNASAAFSGYSAFAPFGPVYTQGRFPVSRGYMYLPSFGGLSVWSLGTGSPPLNISITLMNTVLLSWPTPSVAFSVQQSPGLNPSNWVTLTNQSVVVGSQNQVTIPAAGGTTFYRLILQ